MATTVVEIAPSRTMTEGPRPSTERLYHITEAADETAAIAALVAAAPATVGSLVRQSWDVKPLDGGANLWEGRVQYGASAGTRPPAATNEKRLTFRSSGRTRHITSVPLAQHLGDYVASGTAPNFKGVIGVGDAGGENQVEGVDVDALGFQFTITWYPARALVTSEYIASLNYLAALTPVNDAPWSVTADGVTLSFKAGEVRLLAYSGSPRNDDDWELAFDFEFRPNLAGVIYGDIAAFDVDGWDYVWTRNANVVDTSANVLVKRPVSAHLERLYQRGWFDLLGLN